MKIHFLSVILALTTFTQGAHSEPRQTQETQIQRTVENMEHISTVLSQNLYKTEKYEDNYSVEIPYQTTEEYIEQVPYTETVPYTDYETSYSNEWRCHTVTKYKKECRQERLCTPTRGACQEVTECGTNARKERICKTRKVCNQDREECRTESRCSDIPHREEECGFEYVATEKPVTKYRKETRYREEVRTRTVTRYRTENRCCVTRTRQIFDRQWQLNVNLEFSKNNILLANEKETFTLTLTGTEKQPDVSLKFKSNFYEYIIKRKELRGNTLTLELDTKYKYTTRDIDASTISNLSLKFKENTALLSFTDLAQIPRLKTLYRASILQNDSVVLSLESVQPSFKIENLDRHTKYKVQLEVVRQSSLFQEKTFSFSLETNYEKISLTENEIADLKISSLVKLGQLDKSGKQSNLTFTDLSVDSPDVTTTYQVIIWKKIKRPLWLKDKIERIGSIKIQRGLQENTRDFKVPLNLGISEEVLTAEVTSDKSIYIDLFTTRQSSDYLGSQIIKFQTNKNF